MNIYKSECMYDPETKQWIEHYWMNGNGIDGDTYFSIMDNEKYIEDKKFEQEQEINDECFKYKDDECCECCCDECDNEEEYEKELVCDDNCKKCDIPADMCVDIHIVKELASEFEESDCQCRSCLRNTIYNALVRGKSMWWDDCRLSLIEVLSDD